MRTPVEGHLGDEASGYVDGELTDTERRSVEEHLAACAACRDLVEIVSTVRTRVRSIGAVEPPTGFLDELVRTGPRPTAHGRRRRRHRVRIGLAQLAATAAVWLVILGVGLVDNDVAPEVPSYLRAHTAEASALGSSTPSNPDTAAAEQAQVPPMVGDTLVLVRVTSAGGVQQAVYRDRTTVVSVFVEAGDLDTGALPEDAQVVVVAPGLEGYRIRSSDADVYVVPRGGVVYTIVSPRSHGRSVSGDLPSRPAPSPSIADRIEGAGRGLLDTFGLAG